jgi:hypothetical protein
MKAFDCTGRWWLPDDELHGVPGTLKVSQSGELRLRLLGSLGADPGSPSKKHPVILGWVEENLLGDKVTLVGCVLWGSRSGSHEVTRENYFAARGFFGGHLRNQEEFVFTSMSLRLAGLSEWAHDRTGFGQEQFAASLEEKTPLLTYTHLNPLDAKVPGGRLLLSVGLGSHGTHRDRQFQEDVGLSVFTETARSANDLNYDFVYPLQNLMTFVCDRPQEVKDFVVRPGEFPENLRGDIHVVEARVQPEEDVDRPEPVHYFQMLFTLADVDFVEFIGKWLRVTKRFVAACNAFFGIQYGPPAFIDMSFPYVLQSLYLYHSQRPEGAAGRGEEEGRLKKILTGIALADADWIVDRLGTRPFPPLHLVLRQLVEEHGHVMNALLSHRLDRFVSEVANTLKYLAFRDAEMQPAARHGVHLYWMMQRLRFLFKSCLMHELDFPKDKVKSLFERNGLYQHVCQIEEAEERERQKT